MILPSEALRTLNLSENWLGRRSRVEQNNSADPVTFFHQRTQGAKESFFTVTPGKPLCNWLVNRNVTEQSVMQSCYASRGIFISRPWWLGWKGKHCRKRSFPTERRSVDRKRVKEWILILRDSFMWTAIYWWRKWKSSTAFVAWEGMKWSQPFRTKNNSCSPDLFSDRKIFKSIEIFLEESENGKQNRFWRLQDICVSMFKIN